MRIPVGGFGNAIPDAAPRVNIPAGAFSEGQGMEQLGNTGMQVAAGLMADERQQEAALQRTKAANDLLDHEIAIKTAGQDIAQQLADGSLNHKDAPDAWRSRIADIQKPDTSRTDPVTAENLAKGVKRNEFVAATSIAQSINSAKIVDQKAEVDLGLDKILKLAGLPGADVPAELAKMDAYDEQGRLVYGKNWASKKSAAADAAWFNEAQYQVLKNGSNLDSLKAMEADLNDPKGSYAKRLDPEKRNIILRAVQNERVQVENRIQHNLTRMEAKGERTINEIDRQIASGVKTTPQMWTAWAATVRGTPSEGEFKQRVHDENVVQQVLRMPIDQQQTFVQEKEAALLNAGGSWRDKSNIDRLKSAVDANVKQLKETPLLFAQNRTGQPVEPLDATALADPTNGKMADMMNERVATIAALQKHYGPQVQMRPLLPHEADFLGKALDNATPKQQADLFGTLRIAIKDDKAYRAAMQQIAPDNPVMAGAGILASKNIPVANQILRGQQLLRPDKKTDGTGKLFTMPPEKDLLSEFSNRESDAFAGKEQARNAAYQTAKSIYAAKSADSGDFSGQLDYKRWRESITAATGGFERYKGRSIVLPYGMEYGAFKDGIKARTAAIVDSKALDATFTQGKLRDLPLENVGDGRYIFRVGDGMVTDKSGKPVILDFNQ